MRHVGRRTQTVFLDENARVIDDPDHSDEEERFLPIGFSFQARCLIVTHCYRETGSIIRLISARRANRPRRKHLLETSMRNEYDFSNSWKNPYVKHLKRQVTIRLDAASVDYFKKMAAELGMPYQNVINLFLRDCAQRNLRPVIQWTAPEPRNPPGK